jgi:hypothetical protein
MISRLCLATLLAWWGLVMLHASWSVAQVVEATKPAAAKSDGEGHVGEIDEEQDLRCLSQRVQKVGETQDFSERGSHSSSHIGRELG